MNDLITKWRNDLHDLRTEEQAFFHDHRGPVKSDILTRIAHLKDCINELSALIERRNNGY